MKNIQLLKNKVHRKIRKIIITDSLKDRKIKSMEKKIWGRISLSNSIYLCLYYLIYYPSMEILEEEFSYPLTNFSNLLNKFFEQYSILV